MDLAQWNKLLTWLSSHGMQTGPDDMLVTAAATPGAGFGLFATKDCPPATPLFTIPATAMINVKSLSSHYSSTRSGSSLTGIQLVSLHLCLYRPRLGEDSHDPAFGPYISVLPRDFDAHPLSWLVHQETSRDETKTYSRLLEALPPSVMNALRKLATRYWDDWNAVREYLDDYPGLIAESRSSNVSSTDYNMDFLWGWLNVNTRCIYHRLKASRSDQDNFSLCPILDFANHRPGVPSMFPIPCDAEIWDTIPLKREGDSLSFLSPKDTAVSEGQELYLVYGAHVNRTLFVEYGFVNDIPKTTNGEGFDGEVDVYDLVESTFQKRGALGSQMKEILVQEGYWGDWTIHGAPKPAHPSFRLITALRLYHLGEREGALKSQHVELWRDTHLGKRDTISPGNETSWRTTLVNICTDLIHRGETSIGSMETRIRRASEQDWVKWKYGNIQQLWEEEILVATAVSQSVANGEEF